jgi:hypothetical protein
MEKEFIPYEQALELKELGFDEPCLAYLKPNVLTYEITIGEFNEFEYHSAPLYQQAFRWFREKYEVKVISVGGDNNKKFNYLLHLKDNNQVLGEKCNTYEEAELACLKQLIEIVKEKL